MSKNAASLLDIPESQLLPFGPGMHKVYPASKEDVASGAGKLILVSAITPTKAGEGKTTTSIGLADGLRKIGKNSCVALREPSLGPCFGVKGGGTGGGRAQLVPSDRINLHFTGDFHAITSAHNLLSAVIDNHLHHGSDLNLDGRRVTWPRVLDVNDRALRHVVTGLGGRPHGQPRDASFDITAASELMAMLCLAENAEDLEARINRAIIGVNLDKEPVRAGQLGVTGAMMALLRDALLPNLVETMEGTPAFVHGGPFANIAHGCNSVMATRTALKHADWVITEAGFGFDLGAEKFFDIKCRSAGLDPHLVVLVASARALKLHGGVKADALEATNVGAVKAGLANLDKHLESIGHFGKKAVVALNRFDSDADEEVAVVREHLAAHGVRFATATHFMDGGEGAIELAKQVVELGDEPTTPNRPVYELSDSIPDKIHKVAKEIYGADDVTFMKSAERDMREIERFGLQGLPICLAKTQSSLSDDPKLLGRPMDWGLTVRSILPNAGAGFLVVLTGDILRMPGLPKKPQAEAISLDGETIVNLR
ncbi:MAG: formate--tetrahydrofolate ligase [Myxococcales bacterium]|nr:formate--tetrahydrofolate ligase [Myxococcales bacterium]